MKKILFIIPHLSTGGLPQVVVNKVELLKNDYEVKCIEYDFLGDAFVVQRNRLINLVGKENLVTLPNDKNILLNIISNYDPDVISMEEFPEYFMSDEISKNIYIKNRSYTIIETTHDSSFNPSHKRWFPDKFIFVSAFNAFRYSMYDIPYEIIEYPIDKKIPNKEVSQKKLGLDPNYKHVVCVGLFTQRKNQGYLFEIAKNLVGQKILFHFIGNQADNFADYWKPLMSNKPNNCIVWGERSDVDIFLQASDLFFFPSKGDRFNKELNPIAIKEALTYNLPMLMFNLDVYCGKYNNEKNIKFLMGDIKHDTDLLLEILSIDNFDPKINVNYDRNENKIFLDYYGEDNPTFNVSIKCITSTAPIYWFHYNPIKNSQWFVIPIPVHVTKFYGNPYFKGFSIEFYDSDNNLKFTREILVNDIEPKTPKLNFKPFDCSYRNYIEFFVEDIYSCFNINDMDIVLDIGANIGLYSKYMYQKKNANKMILVEANPFLEKNIKTLLSEDYERSKIYLAPLSGKKEMVKFNYSTSNSTIGTTEFDSTSQEYSELNSTMFLDTITLDEIINENNIKRISLFKCDIEGGEYDLIESLTDDQMNMIDMFMVEFHGNTDRRILKIINKLEKFGFKSYLYKLTMVTHKKVDIDEPHGVLVTKKNGN